MVPQQGPNYALAKRLQRWRATVARRDGALVSMNVAPPTRTKSVVKNRALAAAYAGAHRFGVEVFEPATSNVLMAALLVHDLHTGGGPKHEHPWQDEAYAAAHGGLWRAPYAPRSALGLAALLGYGAARVEPQPRERSSGWALNAFRVQLSTELMRRRKVVMVSPLMDRVPREPCTTPAGGRPCPDRRRICMT